VESGQGETPERNIRGGQQNNDGDNFVAQIAFIIAENMADPPQHYLPSKS
jgi:hypothetical protein